MTRAALVALLLVAAPAAASAQITFHGFADAGATAFTATKSFEAILGQSSGPVYGGGVQLGERRFMLLFGVDRFRREGHRVFIFQNEVFHLNTTDTITVTPVDLTFGYRLRSSGIVPYVGGGGTWFKYQEESEHAAGDENVNKTFSGYNVLAGVEVPIGKWFGAAVDAKWAVAPGAFEDSPTSVAGVYDEHDLGGFTLRARILIGR